jgi:hypothetical protein
MFSRTIHNKCKLNRAFFNGYLGFHAIVMSGKVKYAIVDMGIDINIMSTMFFDEFPGKCPLGHNTTWIGVMNDDKYKLVGKLIIVYINCYGIAISDTYEVLRLTLETYGIPFRFPWIYDMK